MNWIPKPQEIYKHFKGNLYQIITLAEHSETGEGMVIYRSLYGDFKVYARSLEMFTSKVDKEKYPDVEQEYRFELQQVAASYGVKGKVVAATGPQKAGGGGVIHVEEGREPLKAEKDVQEIDVAKELVGSSLQEEPALDPLVLEFLDADSHEKRLNILAALHHRMTDDMITTMAVACDVEVPEGALEERYSQLKSCLLMLDRFEVRRK